MTILTKPEINHVFSTLAAYIKNPKGELHYTNAFTLLVAVILSAQATDAGVNKATAALFQVADTPEKLVRLGTEKLKTYINSLNYYNTKAKHLMEMSQALSEKYNGKVPQTFDELTSLSGVGRKTANVVLNIAFGQPTIAVDTHILRVSQRLGLSDGTTPIAVERDLLTVTPKKYIHEAHHLLLLFGRYTCKARNPLCDTCPLVRVCKWENRP